MSRATKNSLYCYATLPQNKKHVRFFPYIRKTQSRPVSFGHGLHDVLEPLQLGIPYYVRRTTTDDCITVDAAKFIEPGNTVKELVESFRRNEIAENAIVNTVAENVKKSIVCNKFHYALRHDSIVNGVGDVGDDKMKKMLLRINALKRANKFHDKSMMSANMSPDAVNEYAGGDDSHSLSATSTSGANNGFFNVNGGCNAMIGGQKKRNHFFTENYETMQNFINYVALLQQQHVRENVRANCIECYLDFFSKNKLCCFPFLKFPNNVIVRSDYFLTCLCPPSMFTKINTKCFEKSLFLMIDNHDLTNEAAKIKGKRMEKDSIVNFKTKQIFLGGSLDKLIQGKESTLRQKAIASKIQTRSFTMVVDSRLPPNVVKIPRSCLENTCDVTQWVFVKRDPSINDKCIYLCRAVPHDNANSTIVMNAWILNGMHADQDGDQIRIFFVPHTNPMAYYKTYEHYAMFNEFDAFSWEHGDRKSVDNKPRYSVSQFHLMMIAEYEHLFIEHCDAWYYLTLFDPDATVKQKCETIMNLSDRHVQDEFVELVMKITESYENVGLRLFDLLSLGEAVKEDVHQTTTTVPVDETREQMVERKKNEKKNFFKLIVDSGAIGTDSHLLEIAQFIDSCDDSETLKINQRKLGVEYFNHTIKNANKLSQNGAETFNCLQFTQTLTLSNNKLHINRQCVWEDLDKSYLMIGYYFSPEEANYEYNKLIWNM